MLAPTNYTSARTEASVNREEVEQLLSKLRSLSWGAPSVAYLVETPEPHRHISRTEVRVLVGRGFAGDHDKKSYYRGEYVPGREVSAIAIEVLEAMGIDPVAVGDNLITAGVDLAALEEGDMIRIGDVLLERSWKTHRPCVPFRNRTSPEIFSAISRSGMRGALFLVRKGGRIRRGDAIVVSGNPDAR